MSQIPCKQAKRLEMTGWFTRYFPGRFKKAEKSQKFVENNIYGIQQDDTMKEAKFNWNSSILHVFNRHLQSQPTTKPNESGLELVQQSISSRIRKNQLLTGTC